MFFFLDQTYLQVTQPVLTRLTRFVSASAEGKASVVPSMFSLLAREDGIVHMVFQKISIDTLGQSIFHQEVLPKPLLTAVSINQRH